jgi:hypothetical protein
MGGNLLTKGKRTARDKYLQIEKEIIKYLDIEIGSDNYRIPRYYKTKETFGDMDIIINNKFFDLPKYMQISFKDKLINHFDISQYKTIGGTFHTLYEGLQVDYFSVDISKLQTISNYMDYGVGNFIGKIARKFNLKYGMDGLSYVYRSSDNYYKNELLISTDLEKIFKLFDLDYTKWKQGFIDKKDAFDWIISSKFFSTYTYYNQKPSTKKREKNRQEFKDFISYLRNNNIDKDITFASEEAIFDTIKEIFLNVDIISFINENALKYKNILRIKEKFNANVINELYPNLKGKELGNFIFKFKEYVNHNYGDFNNYIINIPKENIDKLINQYYNNYFKK